MGQRSPRRRQVPVDPRELAVLIARRAALGAYVVLWLLPTSAVRTRVGRRLLAVGLLGVAVWAVVQANPLGALQDSMTRSINTVVTPLLPPSTDPCDASAPRPLPRACHDPTRVALSTNPAGAILHAPSVGVRAIWRVLVESGSPLADNSVLHDGRSYAEYIWDAGRASGVDPAILMGMFNVESKYGRDGVARLTHSPGNARVSEPGQANVEGYAAYPDWFAGIDATYALLRSYAVHGAPTIDTAIPVWAPSSDNNDPAAYISIIRNTMAYLAALNG